MKIKLIEISTLATVALTALIWTGCKSITPDTPDRSGFLSTYGNLEQIDSATWRYVNDVRMKRYTKFNVVEVKVLADEYQGEPLTPEQRKNAAEYVRGAIIKELSTKYQITDIPGADVGEIHVALTQAYKKGLQIGLSVEGEIVDSYSNVQVAAALRSEMGEAYIGKWWDNPAARELVNKWAVRIREGIDAAHAK